MLLGLLAGWTALPFDRAAVALAPAEARFWLAVTWLGDAPRRLAVGLAIAAWLAWRGWPGGALILLSVTAIETLGGAGLKELFGRARPELVPHLDEVMSLAYPSGHAAHSAALYLLGAGLAGHELRRRELARALFVLAAVLVTLIGLSRVMLGVHWPSDVAGGWMLGSGFALAGLSLARLQRPRARPRNN